MERFGAGRVAIVTGGSRGIGRGIALGLHKCGFSILVNYHARQEEAEDVVEEIESSGGNAVAVRADASQSNFGERLFDAAEEKLGGVDILVNNAGMLISERLSSMDQQTFEKVISTNLFGTFSTARQALKRMREGGRIINMSSTALHMSLPGYAAYNAAKAGIEAMSKVLAKEFAARKITVNVVAPGPTKTELFFQGKDEETIDRLKNMSPFRRLGIVDDIVPLVLFLCSPDASWVTGQTVRVNGGIA